MDSTNPSTKGPSYVETRRDSYWVFGDYYYDGEFQSTWMQKIPDGWEYIGKPGTFEPVEPGDRWNLSRKGLKYVPYTGQTWRKRV